MKLQVKGLSKHYGSVQALDGVSFELGNGECVAMIGPNGAGKSTCFACLAGQEQASSGSVSWAGTNLDGLTPQRRLALGVARTFQQAQTFEALTLLQSLQLLTRYGPDLPSWNVLEDSATAPALALLRRVGLESAAGAFAGTLSYGAKRRLELAMALAGCADKSVQAAPRLLLLDEPAAGLGLQERAELMLLIKSLVSGQDGQAGMAVLYTEHNMDTVFGVADRVLVLIDGKLAAQGSAQEVARNPTVRERYLGTEVLP